jgi:hypothetical protein
LNVAAIFIMEFFRNENYSDLLIKLTLEILTVSVNVLEDTPVMLAKNTSFPL